MVLFKIDTYFHFRNRFLHSEGKAYIFSLGWIVSLNMNYSKPVKCF